jgi:hypothetical protein
MVFSRFWRWVFLVVLLLALYIFLPIEVALNSVFVVPSLFLRFLRWRFLKLCDLDILKLLLVLLRSTVSNAVLLNSEDVFYSAASSLRTPWYLLNPLELLVVCLIASLSVELSILWLISGLLSTELTIGVFLEICLPKGINSLILFLITLVANLLVDLG